MRVFNDEARWLHPAVPLNYSDPINSPRQIHSSIRKSRVEYLTLSWVGLSERNLPLKQLQRLTIAAQAESPYKTNALTYNLLGNAILKGEYTKVSAEYNEKFGNKPPSPEQEIMLKQIMHLGDRAIDAYARAIALSTKPEEQDGRTKMLTQLTNLYKSFLQRFGRRTHRTHCRRLVQANALTSLEEQPHV